MSKKEVPKVPKMNKWYGPSVAVERFESGFVDRLWSKTKDEMPKMN